MIDLIWNELLWNPHKMLFKDLERISSFVIVPNGYNVNKQALK